MAVATATVVKQRIFKWSDYVLYVPLTLVMLTAMGWLVFHWLLLAQRGLASAVFWVATFLLLYTFSITLFRWLLLPWMSRPVQMKAEQNWRVGVATTFVPGLESLEMLERTIAALVAMNVPHDTWVLD